MTAVSLISLVDDDPSVRESLPDLLKQFGYQVRTFAAAEAFLTSDALAKTRCLLLDVALPGMSGPELQRDLALRGLGIPIIFITAQTDETLPARLLKQGAADFLMKPFSDTALLHALYKALRESRPNRICSRT
jgi:FixJ family two-component response regulator